MTTATLIAPDRSATWELDRGRCAVEVSLALPGATIWRARLRPVTARLTGDDPLTLTATLSPRPTMMSLPLTRPLFLRHTARIAQLQFSAESEPAHAGRLVGTVTLDARTWPVQLVLRRTPVGDGRLLVTVAGRVVRPLSTFPGTVFDIEAVAEFVRCA